MLGPSPRQTSLLVRFAVVALTLLALVKFLPPAAGAERPGGDAVSDRTIEPPAEPVQCGTNPAPWQRPGLRAAGGFPAVF
ncbi:MAG: hypothetical protein HYV96_15635 [Opitutae bacterium]|nr:hypothetical protein [Opitutae bacterium]